MGLLQHLPKIIAVVGAGAGIVVAIVSGWFAPLVGVAAIACFVYLGFRWKPKEPG